MAVSFVFWQLRLFLVRQGFDGESEEVGSLEGEAERVRRQRFTKDSDRARAEPSLWLAIPELTDPKTYFLVQAPPGNGMLPFTTVLHQTTNVAISEPLPNDLFVHSQTLL